MTGHCNLNCPSETFSMATRDDLARFDAGFKGLTNRTSLLAIKRVARIAHLDVGREIRKGLPEIILAEGKAPKKSRKSSKRWLTGPAGQLLVEQRGNTCAQSALSEFQNRAFNSLKGQALF